MCINCCHLKQIKSVQHAVTFVQLNLTTLCFLTTYFFFSRLFVCMLLRINPSSVQWNRLNDKIYTHTKNEQTNHFSIEIDDNNDFISRLMLSLLLSLQILWQNIYVVIYIYMCNVRDFILFGWHWLFYVLQCTVCRISSLILQFQRYNNILIILLIPFCVYTYIWNPLLHSNDAPHSIRIN